MFLDVSVIVSIGGYVWEGGMHCRGVCKEGGDAWQGRGCGWQWGRGVRMYQSVDGTYLTGNAFLYYFGVHFHLMATNFREGNRYYLTSCVEGGGGLIKCQLFNVFGNIDMYGFN